MKSWIIVALIYFIITTARGQESVNYKPKALLNELEKYAGEAFTGNIQELEINDTLLLKRLWKGKYFTFENKKAECPVKYVYIGRVNSCRAGGCSISNSANSPGQSEYFDYYILFDKNISVYKVKVFNYRATHGQEVTATGWLKQFVGYNGNKNIDVGSDVDAISGATISVYGITADIETKTKYLQQIVLKRHYN
jgi:Na+-translocating ferredoxin:NAD+ oxidoreductase RnfG subunit